MFLITTYNKWLILVVKLVVDNLILGYCATYGVNLGQHKKNLKKVFVYIFITNKQSIFVATQIVQSRAVSDSHIYVIV